MKIFAIANIMDGKQTIGFRLLDVDSRQVKDVPYSSVRDVLLKGKAYIENLNYKHGKVVGRNGSIDRLPKIVNGKLKGKSPLIILARIEDEGYLVANYKGKISKVNVDDAIKYAKIHGIANGKLVNRDGKEFISAIEGEYDELTERESRKEILAQKERSYIARSKVIGTKELDIVFTGDEAILRKVLNKEIESLIIPDYVTRIDNGACAELDKLREVEIPNSVRVIDSYAFRGCKNLRSVVLPESVSYIGLGVFSLCKSLTNINIPKNVKVLPELIFYGSGLKGTFRIPGHIREVGNSVFDSTGIESIIIEDGVEVIDDYAFSNMPFLKEVIMSDSVIKIGYGTFKDNKNLTFVRLSNRLDEIPSYCFYNCRSLKEIEIPNGVKSIGKEAFNLCFSLESVILPDSVVSMGEMAFDSCTGIRHLKLSKNLREIPRNAFFINEFSIDDDQRISMRQIKLEINIPDGVEVIHTGAFMNRRNIEKVVLPRTLKKIGQDAFLNCISLKEVHIPKELGEKFDKEFVKYNNHFKIVRY